MYKNYIEVVVDEMLTPLLSEYKKTKPDICTCDKCAEDIKALALNNMPPQYVVEEKGNILKRVDYDFNRWKSSRNLRAYQGNSDC